jgi:hypothetical protein
MDLEVRGEGVDRAHWAASEPPMVVSSSPLPRRAGQCLIFFFAVFSFFFGPGDLIFGMVLLYCCWICDSVSFVSVH